MLRRPLIWRGVCPWDKSAITRSRRISSQSNRRFFGRRLAARAALSASSARYYPSGPVWRAISRHTTEGLRPIKWAIHTWDKPASSPAMIAARSSTPSIRRHPMISLQTAPPLHEKLLTPYDTAGCPWWSAGCGCPWWSVGSGCWFWWVGFWWAWVLCWCDCWLFGGVGCCCVGWWRGFCWGYRTKRVG